MEKINDSTDCETRLHSKFDFSILNDAKCIYDIVHKNNPNLSLSSLRSYTSVIKNLYIRVARSINFELAKKFFETNYEEVIAFMIDFPYQTRKTKFATLVNFVDKTTCAYKEYRKGMNKDWSQYKTHIEKQMMEGKMRNNWITQEELKKLYNRWQVITNGYFLVEDHTREELYFAQKRVAIALYFLIPPRRLQDYTVLKMRNYTETDNYWEDDRLVINTYKTAKCYGCQTIKIPPTLQYILEEWKRIYKGEYVLIPRTGECTITQPQLTNLLNEILGKGRSVNMLRHSYITETALKDLPKYTELEKQAQQMGHSVEQMMMYKKFME